MQATRQGIRGGFTVALFISELAFSEAGAAAQAKIAILVASATAGGGGLLPLLAGGEPPSNKPYDDVVY